MDAFISYRRKPSSSLALLLQSKLKTEHKIDAYVDTTRTDGTTVQFPERLMQAIADKKIFICLLGDSTLDSEWVLKEIEQAYSLRKRCIPIFQESYLPLDNPPEAVKYMLSFDGVHVLDVKNIYIDEAIAQIAQLVKAKEKAKKQSFNLMPALFAAVLLIALVISAFMLAPLLQANPTDEATDIVFAPSDTATDEPSATNTPTDEPTITDTDEARSTDTATERPTVTDTPTESPIASPTISAYEYYTLGIEAFSAGDYELALERYNRAIELEPNYAAVFANRCYTYFLMEEYDAAMDDCNQAIELDPDNESAFYSRGRIHYNLGNYEEAIVDFTRTIEIIPNFDDVYNSRGLAYYYQEDFEAAIEDYNRAIELDPTSNSAYYINRGLAYYYQEDFEAAIEDYNRALIINPYSAIIYNNRGIAYSALGDYNMAIDNYNRAIELDPAYSLAYANRGSAYYRLGQYEEALADYQMAEELAHNFNNIQQARYDELRATVTPNP